MFFIMPRFFTNYRKERIVLGDGAYEHITEVHPEVSLDRIKATLEDPDEVRKSSHKDDSELYYMRRTSRRYICVVVKICRDGNFISTALTTTAPKMGKTMYIYFDEKTDYLEVLEKKSRNYSVPLKNGIFKILSEKSNKVIGYGVEDASKRLDELKIFDPLVKLSIMIKMSRLKHHFTQQQLAKKLNIGLLPYQRLESGQNNPTFKTLLKVKEVLTDIDLSKVA